MSPEILIQTGDALTWLRRLQSDSVHCVVTSSPYFGLRDYGVADQIGLEPTPAEYVAKLVEIFREVRRVLRPDGTLWLNLGDSYIGGGRGGGGSFAAARPGWTDVPMEFGKKRGLAGFKHKDLLGIPWMVAFALRTDGWYLRQDIIWAKPNPMPESVQDRCTKSHEYLFLLSKSKKYYFDAEAIAEPVTESSKQRLAQPSLAQQHGSERVPGKTNGPMKAVGNGETRNRRSVWNIATRGYKEAHFATFPPALVEPCILAGCPADGIVLDPFGGAGTTALVARQLGRRSILLELNPAYVEIARKRLELSPLSCVTS